MKKLLFLLFISFSFSVVGQPADSLRYLTDTVLSIMRNNALNKDKLDWTRIEKEFNAATKGIVDKDSLPGKFSALFRAIGDYHGGIQTKTKYISWNEGKPKVVVSKVLDSAFKRGPHLLVQRWNDIGYFRMPGGTTKNVGYVTQMLVDSLCKVNPSTVKGWIIDLRLNSGGNVWFMLASLAPLIGEGRIGGVQYADGSSAYGFIQNGKVSGNNQIYEVPVKTCALPASDVPVVVLIGAKTASSAEALALAFRGRKKSIMIGEPSAGLTTSNNSYPLSADVTLVLSTGYMTDRNGNTYSGAIQPDILVEGNDDFYDLQKDLKVKKAIEWLQRNSKPVRN
jgi:carboxyl-terminal processing protease